MIWWWEIQRLIYLVFYFDCVRDTKFGMRRESAGSMRVSDVFSSKHFIIGRSISDDVLENYGSMVTTEGEEVD